MKKTLVIFLINLMIGSIAIADTERKEVKDCFESVNRATFAFGKGKQFVRASQYGRARDTLRGQQADLSAFPAG